MFAICRHFLSSYLILETVLVRRWAGSIIFKSILFVGVCVGQGGGRSYWMRVVTCGCCVLLYQLNLIGWEGGRGEQQAGTPTPSDFNKTPQKRKLNEKSEEFKVVTVHEYTQLYGECTTKEESTEGGREGETSNCTFFDLLELLQCQKKLLQQDKEVPSLKTVGKQYRDSVHVYVHSQWCFQCGRLEGKYRCLFRSPKDRTIRDPPLYVELIPLWMYMNSLPVPYSKFLPDYSKRKRPAEQDTMLHSKLVQSLNL